MWLMFAVHYTWVGPQAVSSDLDFFVGFESSAIWHGKSKAVKHWKDRPNCETSQLFKRSGCIFLVLTSYFWAPKFDPPKPFQLPCSAHVPAVAGSSMKTSVAWCIPCDRQKRWLETRPFVCRRVDLRCRISDAIWMPFKGLRLINPIFEADIYRALCFASLGILRVCFFRSYLRLGRKKAVRSYQLSEATWTLVKPYQTSLFGHRLPICYAFLAVLISCCAHSGLAPVNFGSPMLWQFAWRTVHQRPKVNHLQKLLDHWILFTDFCWFTEAAQLESYKQPTKIAYFLCFRFFPWAWTAIWFAFEVNLTEALLVQHHGNSADFPNGFPACLLCRIYNSSGGMVCEPRDSGKIFLTGMFDVQI